MKTKEMDGKVICSPRKSETDIPRLETNVPFKMINPFHILLFPVFGSGDPFWKGRRAVMELYQFVPGQ
jgi:hypothetical protein